MVAAGDHLVLVDRRSPEWTILRLSHVLYVDTLDRDELVLMSALPHLPESWRRLAARRLERMVVEDWSSRLAGNASCNQSGSN